MQLVYVKLNIVSYKKNKTKVSPILWLIVLHYKYALKQSYASFSLFYGKLKCKNKYYQIVTPLINNFSNTSLCSKHQWKSAGFPIFILCLPRKSIMAFFCQLLKLLHQIIARKVSQILIK